MKPVPLVHYSIMEYSAPAQGLRGFPVEFAVLGFLLEKPMHGYALRTRIEDGLGPLWKIASSQLYQVLRRLQSRGWITRRSQRSPGGPPRAVYQATDRGRLAFWSWVEEPVHAMRDVRVEFAAKLYFIRRLRLHAVGTLIDRQISALQRMQHHIQSQSHGDDAKLQAAWQSLQQSTVENFSRWLHSHRNVLQHPKEDAL